MTEPLPPSRTQATEPSPEASRLPMPADASRVGGPGITSSDTFQVLSNAGAGAGSSLGGVRGRGGDPGGSGGGSNLDTLVGRLVIEQGLATSEEVEAARRKVSPDDPNHQSLAQLLVEESVITTKQLLRLRQMVEQERSGQTIPGYKVLEKLGAGAMATVYKARQLSLDRLVAIKILPRKFSTNPQFIERFYAEGRAAAQLNHPNIVQAFDVAQAGEFHYFVMEFVDGQTVHDMIVANRRFAEAEAIDIAMSVAEALDHAHGKGLIHRDVKPKNVMFTPGGVVKLADLGLARAMNDKEAAEEEAGKAYGTPYYISPEQIRGEVSIGPQADIYSLGATLYHMVTGNVPFNGKNPTEVMQKHLKTPLVPPDHVNPKLSPGISEVIERMMAKSRKDRYKTCQELLTDLRAIKRGEAPPIAHQDAPVAALEAVLKSSAAMSTPMAEDRSRQASPFNHPKVKVLIGVTIAAIAFGAVMTVVAILGMVN